MNFHLPKQEFEAAAIPVKANARAKHHFRFSRAGRVPCNFENTLARPPSRIILSLHTSVTDFKLLHPFSSGDVSNNGMLEDCRCDSDLLHALQGLALGGMVRHLPDFERAMQKCQKSIEFWKQ